MDLQFRSLPAAYDWLMVSIDPEISAIDVIDKVTKGVFNSHELSDVGTVPLLLWSQ